MDREQREFFFFGLCVARPPQTVDNHNPLSQIFEIFCLQTI